MNSRISAEDAARRSTADGPVNTHTSVLANIALEADHDCISHSQTDRDISRTHGQGIAFLQSDSHQIHWSQRSARSWKRPARRQAIAPARAEGQNNGFFPGFGWLCLRDKGKEKC